MCLRYADTPACHSDLCFRPSVAGVLQPQHLQAACKPAGVSLSSLLVTLQVAFPAISPGATALAAHKWLLDAHKKVEEGGAGCLPQTVVFLLMQQAARCSLGLTAWPDSPAA